MKNKTADLNGLSVVLPAYNEEEIIADTLGRAVAYCRGKKIPFEIIVVNDGSSDRTGAIIEEAAKVFTELRPLHHSRNLGYGEALRSGFDAASFDWIFLMDSDGQFDIRQLDDFIPYAGAHDMIFGYRAPRADPPHRVIYGWGWTLFVNLLFGMSFKDLNCAFKLFRRSVWQTARPVVANDHKIFTVEWLWNSKRAGLLAKELPVRHYPRLKGKQTGARPYVVFQMLKSLIKLRWP